MNCKIFPNFNDFEREEKETYITSLGDILWRVDKVRDDPCSNLKHDVGQLFIERNTQAKFIPHTTAPHIFYLAVGTLGRVRWQSRTATESIQ